MSFVAAADSPPCVKVTLPLPAMVMAPTVSASVKRTVAAVSAGKVTVALAVAG